MCINNHKVNKFKEKYFDHLGTQTLAKRGDECHIFIKYFCMLSSARHDFFFSLFFRLRKPKLCLPLKEAEECVIHE